MNYLLYFIPGTDREFVMCKYHKGCPVLKGKPPTADTCAEFVVLPNYFRPGEGARESRVTSVERYLEFMFMAPEERPKRF